MMDRTIAGILETKKVIEIIEDLLERASFEEVVQRSYEIPDSGLMSFLLKQFAI